MSRFLTYLPQNSAVENCSALIVGESRHRQCSIAPRRCCFMTVIGFILSHCRDRPILVTQDDFCDKRHPQNRVCRSDEENRSVAPMTQVSVSDFILTSSRTVFARRQNRSLNGYTGGTTTQMIRTFYHRLLNTVLLLVAISIGVVYLFQNDHLEQLKL